MKKVQREAQKRAKTRDVKRRQGKVPSALISHRNTKRTGW
jgi:hypothetical protein